RPENLRPQTSWLPCTPRWRTWSAYSRRRNLLPARAVGNPCAVKLPPHLKGSPEFLHRYEESISASNAYLPPCCRRYRPAKTSRFLSRANAMARGQKHL